MAIDYKIGDKLYLPVTVINGASQLYPIKVEFFCDIDTVDNAAIANKPGLLLTAEEVADKDVDERYDAQVDLVTAKAAIDHLQEENKKLKQEVAERDELLSDAADRIKTLEKAADRSIFFEEIANQQEVIDALVEKIQRLKGGD